MLFFSKPEKYVEFFVSSRIYFLTTLLTKFVFGTKFFANFFIWSYLGS